MKIYKLAEDYNKMKSWFEERTNRHIKLVQDFCKKIEEYDPKKFKGLVEQAKDHDASKFEDPEVEPYIYVTWEYKCKDDGIKFEGPEGIKDKMNEATNHHVRHNKHHPESHCDSKDINLINRDDRDKKPDKIVDATKMPDIDVAEMCADWFSMSVEKSSHPKDWADKNVNIRWKFNDKQKDLIYELIEKIWE